MQRSTERFTLRMNEVMTAEKGSPSAAAASAKASASGEASSASEAGGTAGRHRLGNHGVLQRVHTAVKMPHGRIGKIRM